jgi:hypothetical protein
MTNKICARCNERKPTDEFGADFKAKNGLKSYCRQCHRKVNYEWYHSNGGKLSQSARQTATYRERKQWIDRIKLARGCIDCGYNTHPHALQFDHRDGETKLTPGFARVLKNNLEWLKAEIAKCDVRCANCHAIRTSLQHGWQPYFD